MKKQDLDALSTHVRKLTAGYNELAAQFKLLLAAGDTAHSITEEIDAIPGRRIFYNYTTRQLFTNAQNRVRGNAMTFEVSQDGPFVMTHYPLVSWLPSAPSLASNFGRWSPVASWPLPLQQSTNLDVIDLSYEFADGGSQRNFNNEALGPLFSRPDALEALPVPTLFAPSSVISFTPTYENIFFDPGAAQPTEGGTLVVTLPGYRIVQL
jgi:hypothetical protein